MRDTRLFPVPGSSDRIIGLLDDTLRTLFAPPPQPARTNPAATVAEPDLTREQRASSARLLRVDHSGEICAQALYRGQALTARRSETRADMGMAAREEGDHLAWTAERLRELGAPRSVLNPVFYVGSFTIGALAGLAGDRWSLGFVAETERQVARHLDGHLARLPAADGRSRAILEQMKADELRHATRATEHGAAALPPPVQRLMRAAACLMTSTAYRV